MKTYPRAKPRRARHVRVPAFVPVPLRARSDGWTVSRQMRFLVALARTRSVCAAARVVGMARETAYRLRKAHGAGSFAAAWDKVLGRPGPGMAPKRKVTVEEYLARAFGGLVKPVVWRGELTAIQAKADNSALLGHLARMARTDRDAGEGGGRGDGRSQRFAPAFASTDGHFSP